METKADTKAMIDRIATLDNQPDVSEFEDAKRSRQSSIEYKQSIPGAI